MNCINNAIALFQGQNQCAAITVAVAAFILGMVAMCILCKLICPCGKKSCKKDGNKKQQQKKGEEKPFEKRKPHPAPADGSVEIYVGNLSYDMTEDQLREAFGVRQGQLGASHHQQVQRQVQGLRLRADAGPCRGGQGDRGP